ncbi:general stress protein [Niallia sp. NCCP-28]|uniref:general stress protein n=1 Tax=Niallia sp. NCCP-28 TaxID=2934712 RepID=UPI0020816D66|nr:general stress protein [Niallia sp. NCCP-28]GKU83723.1 general stress protein 17M [Niallia sp. NCCP-28]
MYKVEVVENGVQADNIIRGLENQGYERENIYIFAHDKDRSEDLTAATETAEVSIKEQGFLDSLSNVFRKRGDELRSKMQSVGLTEMEAEKYEEVLDTGKLVIVGSTN